MTDPWHEITCTDDRLTIALRPSADRYWPPSELRDRPLPPLEARGKQGVVTGQAPAWMYAHVAAALRAAGAAGIEVRLAAAPGTSDDLDGSSCDLHFHDGDGGRALLQVHLRKDPPLSDEAITHLVSGRLDELRQARPEEVCLTGQASVAVYARAAEAAVAAGARRVLCLTPVNGLVVAFDRGGEGLGQSILPPPWLDALVRAPESSVIVGVTGDPNSGKSVFSMALNAYRAHHDRTRRGWRMDCDGQSPTTPWYRSLLQDGAEGVASAAREAVKRPWTPRMQSDLAEQVGRMRGFFEVVIADLPGGNLKVDPPQRVPPGRGAVFALIDVLVLLAREGRHTEQAWREALAPHGLDDRIAVVLDSQNPQGPPRLELRRDGSLWRGTVEGLDRARRSEDLAAAFCNPLGTLWPALLERGRARQGGE
jgi:hypothetical protein